MLLGPGVATLEGMLIGVEEPPGMWTLVGGGLILAGCGVITFSTRSERAVVHLGEGMVKVESA